MNMQNRVHVPNMLMDGMRLANMVTDITRDKFPATDIIKVGDGKFEIAMALAGYSKEGINISLERNILTVEGEWTANKADYLIEGIAKRRFRRMFPLDEDIEVDSVEFDNGILYIDLHRELPEKQQLKEFKL